MFGSSVTDFTSFVIRCWVGLSVFESVCKRAGIDQSSLTLQNLLGTRYKSKLVEFLNYSLTYSYLFNRQENLSSMGLMSLGRRLAFKKNSKGDEDLE